jgi:membrane protease YdiL (CAAX protease family)
MSRATSATAAATRAARQREEDDAPPLARELPDGYLRRSELPFASLVFLLPLIVLYEVGTRQFATDAWAQTEQRIIAFKLMQDFFRLFGASGRYLPALAVVGILLACHIARNDPWRVHPATLVGMAFEGTLWAFPLLAGGIVALHYLAAGPTVAANWKALLVLSIGAGIYEELVFRLAAFTLLSFVLIDVLDLRKPLAYLLMLSVAALSFSLYHYLGSEGFEPQTFAFRTLAGLYFGLIFLYRGFGITAYSHAAYDVCVVLLKLAARP